jgi:hypothetical protein
VGRKVDLQKSRVGRCFCPKPIIFFTRPGHTRPHPESLRHGGRLIPMANTKCEGCGERHNAWKRQMASGWLRAARRRGAMVKRARRRRAMGKRERRRWSARGEKASVARRAGKRRACKRSAKGWCALHEGEQRQEHAAATAAAQSLADTPRHCYIRLQKY